MSNSSGAPRGPGDLTIRWTRRSRVLAADSWNAPEVPLAEEAEAYEVEILDGATLRRLPATTTTSAAYTAARQIADWGALLGPGDALDIRVYQLSALIGRGSPKSVTLTFSRHPMPDTTTHLLLPWVGETRAGTVELRIPKLRRGSYFPRLPPTAADGR